MKDCQHNMSLQMRRWFFLAEYSSSFSWGSRFKLAKKTLRQLCVLREVIVSKLEQGIHLVLYNYLNEYVLK